MPTIYKICGCGFGFNPQDMEHSCSISRSYKCSAQLHPNDRPVLFTKTKEDGTIDIRFPLRRESPMLPAYKEQGFQRTEFTSYQEHAKFCKENDLVNHAVEGIS